MYEIVTFVLSIATLWTSLNFLYRIVLARRFGKSVKLYYGVALIVRKSSRISPFARLKLKLLVLVGIAVYTISLAVSLATLVSSVLYSIETGSRSIILLLPGINILGEDLLFLLLAIFTGVLLHEYLHAKFAVSSGIPVKSWGFVLALFIPAAFVEVDDEALEKSSRLTKIAVLSAGLAGNLLILMLALGVLQLILNPYGLVVVSVEPGSLAMESGLKPYDVVYYINGVEATLQLLKEQMSQDTGLQLILTVYRSGEGFRNIVVYKKANETVLGITLIPVAPKKPLLVIGAVVFTYLYKMLLWIYLVNFSLLFINALPLFITDGGRIVYYIAGERAGTAINVLATALLVLMLAVGGRV